MNDYALHHEITVLTNKTIDILLSENPDSMTLYLFYSKVCRKQHTNQVWAVDDFCIKGLKWGEIRFRKAKKILQKHNLIEEVTSRKSGKIAKKYIKIKYLWSSENKAKIIDNSPQPSEQGTGPQGTGIEGQMLKVKELNASSNKSSVLKKTHSEEEKTPAIGFDKWGEPIESQPINITDPGFDYDKELKNLTKSTKHIDRVIALVWHKKKYRFANRRQWSMQYGKDSRYAKELGGYDGAEISKVCNFIMADAEDKNYEWGMTTIVKKIADIINREK